LLWRRVFEIDSKAENESRLSDVSLQWMLDAATIHLGDEALLLDRAVLDPKPAADGTAARRNAEQRLQICGQVRSPTYA
jgi:hypothetical protein